MTVDQLSELHIRTFEHLGHAEVIVTHLPTGTTVEASGSDRFEAKRKAYEEMARLLTEKGL